jgi:hypothetical protein
MTLTRFFEVPLARFLTPACRGTAELVDDLERRGEPHHRGADGLRPVGRRMGTSQVGRLIDTGRIK